MKQNNDNKRKISLQRANELKSYTTEFLKYKKEQNIVIEERTKKAQQNKKKRKIILPKKKSI